MPTNQIIANIGKSVMFLLFFLICCPVNAQEQNGWTANDFPNEVNMGYPLNDKWNFDLYGGYTQYKRNSVIIPPTAIPYTIGGGFSYNVGKNMFIGTQTDYQYNILQKKWEWFCGLRFTINF